MNGNTLSDAKKRRTLKGMTGLAAMGALGALPTVTSAAALPGGPAAGAARAAGSLQANALAVTLISSPDVIEDTLLLRNLTDNDIVVDHFDANKVAFSGKLVDVNDACAVGGFRVPAGAEVSRSFLRQDQEHPASIRGQFMDAGAVVDRLPGGTLVVKLGAYLRGSAAVLC